MSRISTRFSASVGLSVGEPFDDCSARSVVETMKGMSWGLTPSLTRSLKLNDAIRKVDGGTAKGSDVRMSYMSEKVYVAEASPKP